MKSLSDLFVIEVESRSCNPEDIRSKLKIGDFIIAICKILEHERESDVQIFSFGEGFLVTQVNKNSVITFITMNDRNSIYLNILSKTMADKIQLSETTAQYFGGEGCLELRQK